MYGVPEIHVGFLLETHEMYQSHIYAKVDKNRILDCRLESKITTKSHPAGDNAAGCAYGPSNSRTEVMSRGKSMSYLNAKVYC